MKTAQTYQTKLVKIEAIEWDGNNYVEILRWSKLKPEQLIGTKKRDISKPDWKLVIPTLEGDMEASIGDYIIKGLIGEFYPCKPEVFHRKYELKQPHPGAEGE